MDFLTAGPASLIWPLEASSVFSVKSIRAALIEEKFFGEPAFPAKTVWANCVPTKVQGFVWLVYNKRIDSMDNLQRRGLQIANRCVLCDRHIEIVDHMFLRCDFSTKVWAMICSKLLIHNPFQKGSNDFIRDWKGMNCVASFSSVMKALMHAAFWSIWLERNDLIFNERENSLRQIFCKIMVSVGNWLRAFQLFSANKLLLWNRLVLDLG
ncbi:hypothetical protein LINGRAHAP2_LOCUS27995 [Linum grandiflorum]